MTNQLKEVCKIGQEGCCRYIIAGANGITCAKLTPLKDVLDARVSKMNAQGDNCKGLDENINLAEYESRT